MKHALVLAAALPLLLLATGVPRAEAGDSSIQVRHLPNEYPALAKVSPRQAFDTVQQKEKGGLLELQLEGEGGSLVYDVEIATPKGEIEEYQVDAVSGKILGKSEEDEEDDEDGEGAEGSFSLATPRAQFPTLAKIDAFSAIEIVTNASQGQFLGLELGEDDGILVYEILVVSPDGDLLDADVDAGTGAILEMEEVNMEHDGGEQD